MRSQSAGHVGNVDVNAGRPPTDRQPIACTDGLAALRVCEVVAPPTVMTSRCAPHARRLNGLIERESGVQLQGLCQSDVQCRRVENATENVTHWNNDADC